MIIPDVNVLVVGFRQEMPDHLATKHWLDEIMMQRRPIGIVEAVAAGFVRVVTQRPFFTSVPDAFAFINRLRAEPNCRLVSPNAQQWSIFEQVCRATGRGGKAAQDAYWASFALELKCEFVTFDGGFAGMPGLTWRKPTDAHARTNPR